MIVRVAPIAKIVIGRIAVLGRKERALCPCILNYRILERREMEVEKGKPRNTDFWLDALKEEVELVEETDSDYLNAVQCIMKNQIRFIHPIRGEIQADALWGCSARELLKIKPQECLSEGNRKAALLFIDWVYCERIDGLLGFFNQNANTEKG